MISLPHVAKLAGGVEASYYTDADTFDDPQLRRALEALGQVDGVASPIVVLPDVSRKAERISPTGLVVATRGTIVPAALPAANGSGVRVSRIDLQISDCSPERLDEVLRELALRVPIYGEDSPALLRRRLRDEDLLSILRGGVPWLAERLDLAEPTGRIEGGGRFETQTDSPAGARRILPDYLFEQGLYDFGILEAGNHFIELQVVDRLLDRECAAAAGVEVGQILLMIHDGSPASLAAQYFQPTPYAKARETDRFESDRWAYHCRFLDSKRAARFCAPGDVHLGIEPDDEAHGRFLSLMAMVCNYGLANRAWLQHVVIEALRSVLGRPDLQATTLTDTLHDCLRPITVDGVPHWIHRHGASEARPAECFATDHPFARTGQLIGLPGAPGRPSMLAAAGRTRATWYTANHGAGRSVDRAVARRRFDEAATHAAVEASGARFLRKGLGRFAGENPSAYKRIDDVLALAEQADLLRGVARLRPIAIYKG